MKQERRLLLDGGMADVTARGAVLLGLERKSVKIILHGQYCNSLSCFKALKQERRLLLDGGIASLAARAAFQIGLLLT